MGPVGRTEEFHEDRCYRVRGSGFYTGVRRAYGHAPDHRWFRYGRGGGGPRGRGCDTGTEGPRWSKNTGDSEGSRTGGYLSREGYSPPVCGGTRVRNPLTVI